MICSPATGGLVEKIVTMPAIAETYSLGLPVEVSKIDQELKKLWQESKGTRPALHWLTLLFTARTQAR